MRNSITPFPKNQMEGWIKLHRKVLESAIFMKPDYFQVWIYILLNVNHADKKIIWNGEEKIIKKGSGIFSQKDMAEKLKISRTTVSRVLKTLENGHQIKVLSNNKYTDIEVVNWAEYQDLTNDEHQTDIKRTSRVHQKNIKRTSSGHQADTNNNDKNYKNEKNEDNVLTHPLQIFISEKLKTVSKLQDQLTEEQAESLIEKFPKELIYRKLQGMENVPDLHKKYKSVYLTLTNWCNSEKEKEKSSGKKERVSTTIQTANEIKSEFNEQFNQGF